MKAVMYLLCLSLFILNSCDQKRVYEKNVDLDERIWIATNSMEFDFTIQDHRQRYNVYYLIRNSPDFPFSRIFIEYALRDETGNSLEQNLKYDYLFDHKTGKPYGNNGLGSVFSHQFPLLMDHHFKQPGHYTIRLDQFNRIDTLQGVFSVGLRVEYAD